MPYITLELDEAAHMLLRQSARVRGISESAWLAEAIRQQISEWPPECLALAGSFADFPLREAPGISDTSSFD